MILCTCVHVYYIIICASLNIFWFFLPIHPLTFIILYSHSSNLPLTSRPNHGHAGSVPTVPPTWGRKKIHAVISWRIIMTIITIMITTIMTIHIIMEEKKIIHTIYIPRIPWRH